MIARDRVHAGNADVEVRFSVLGRYRGRVEHHAVVHRDRGDLTEGFSHGVQIARAELSGSALTSADFCGNATSAA